jgi:hypothetical protein
MALMVKPPYTPTGNLLQADGRIGKPTAEQQIEELSLELERAWL